MIRWYGTGGSWINAGLPNYVAIDRKPENGCEVQNCACGATGVMLQLRLVKTVEEANANLVEEDGELLHGSVAMKDLVSPCFFTHRIVCADSYYSSVACAEELFRHQTRLIGVVKTATKKYPMAYLNNIELTERGDRRSVVAYDKDKKAKLLAFVWVDRERRYFIASTSSMQEGRPWVRKRLRQIVDDDVTEPKTVELVVPQPQVAELYYKCCGMIDQHNRDRQDTLCLEHKVLTKDWSMRVNLSIVAMIMVDCWRVWRLITLSASGDDCIEN